MSTPTPTAPSGPRRVCAGFVDAHHHVWDLDATRSPGWTNPATNNSTDLRHGRPASAERSPEGCLVGGLCASVVVQCLPLVSETGTCSALAARTSWWPGCRLGGPDRSRLGDQLDRLCAGPGGHLLGGVRHLVQAEPDPRWCCGRTYSVAWGRSPSGLVLRPPGRAHQLPAAAGLARQAPDLPLVLDHAGKPPCARATAGLEQGVRRWRGAAGGMQGLGPGHRSRP